MTKPPDLKSTLNLPRTAFPMKANLPQSEPRQLTEWDESGLYQRIQQARAGAPTYVLHDGPPYPTGEITLGTGLNKVLKDLVVKSRTMAGFRAPYVPGWDCHGLPIETQVEKELGGKKGSVSPAEFRRMCRGFAGRYIENHRREFKRLGIFGLWEKPYLTMSFDYEARIAEAFLIFLEKGYVYRGLKPVYWCIFDATALAEAEVEHEDHTSPSIWVRYKLMQDPVGASHHINGQLKRHTAGSISPILQGRRVFAIIWTTTPWTLPHSMALAFHPDFDYAALETGDGTVYLVADQLRDVVGAQCGFKASAVLARFKGIDLEKMGLVFEHPFIPPGKGFPNFYIETVSADYVTLDQGTGIVHTAPGHGAEDFYTGQKYGLETYAPLDDQGRFLEGLPEYKGKTVFEATPHIVALLRQRGALLGEGKLQHSYPHCWRCHNPVIFRATEQWFINLEHAGLRRRALEEVKKVKWTPGWGEERLSSMIATRPDWCVSRQRFWGVPLIVFTCENCGQRFDDYAALRNVVRWFEREGADAWYQHSAEELLPPGVRCNKCDGTRWRKETDILDVWFDSGTSHYAVLGNDEAGPWPADCYLEGPDQYRGWFQSSLLVAMGLKDKAPYKQVVSHGWTLDEKGTPMSKSLGNAIYPAEICEKWGADLLRVWVASQDYTADTRLYPAMMTQLSEAYRKIRNTFRFALSNLADFDPNRDALADAQLDGFDRWMLEHTAELVKQCRGWYEGFEFHRVFHALHDFCVVDLSAFYFDILKDRLYTFAPRSRGRRSAQTAIYRIASALVRLVAPILVFTAEEIWRYLPRRSGDPESVHMALFPDAEDLVTRVGEARKQDWLTLLTFRDDVLKKIEEKRQEKYISSSLEARVVVRSNNRQTIDFWKRYERWLPALFIVSQVQIIDESDGRAPAPEPFGRWSIEIQRASGSKCERCWNYSTRVGESAEYPTVCERCLPVVKELLGGAAAAS